VTVAYVIGGIAVAYAGMVLLGVLLARELNKHREEFAL
jgi:hypothetical protein